MMTQSPDVTRRTRVTRPYPTYTLADALSVARAIYEVNAGLPFDRELLAGALGTTPKSSAFTMRLNASAAYGLTEGGYNDPNIRLTELGEAAVSSTLDEAGRSNAVAAAATNPDTFGRFYRLFDGRRLPQRNYLHNILQRDFGLHPNLTGECISILLENGEFAGIITKIDGQRHVMLPDSDGTIRNSSAAEARPTEATITAEAGPQLSNVQAVAVPDKRSTTIFIGHIGESNAAKYVASMLDDFGIDTSSPQIPDDDAGLLVPQEASMAMRESNAAVLIFRSGDDSWSSRDKMIGMLGAASVLFEDRVVMLHEDGAGLSINLDRLNHVDFDPDRPGESGMKLLRALHRAGVIKVSA